MQTHFHVLVAASTQAAIMAQGYPLALFGVFETTADPYKTRKVNEMTRMVSERILSNEMRVECSSKEAADFLCSRQTQRRYPPPQLLRRTADQEERTHTPE